MLIEVVSQGGDVGLVEQRRQLPIILRSVLRRALVAQVARLLADPFAGLAQQFARPGDQAVLRLQARAATEAEEAGKTDDQLAHGLPPNFTAAEAADDFSESA